MVLNASNRAELTQKELSVYDMKDGVALKKISHVYQVAVIYVSKVSLKIFWSSCKMKAYVIILTQYQKPIRYSLD